MQVTAPDAELLGAIYGASADARAWHDAIDRCTAFVGAGSAALLSLDTLDRGAYSLDVVSRAIREGMTPELVAYWLEHLAPLDEAGHRALLTLPARRIITDLEAYGCSRVELDRRPDCRFLLEHFGLGRKIAARLNDSPRYFESFAFQFPAVLAEIPDGARARMEALLPHVAKAAELGQLFGRLRERYAAALAALDHLGLGICVLDPRRRVILANEEARRILDSGHGVHVDSRGRLGCRDPDDERRMAAAATAAVLDGAAGDTRAESVLAFRRTPDVDPVLVEVSPLRDSLRELNADDGMVFVHLIDLDSATQVGVDAFATVYGLSAAERAVAELIVQGLGNREIADARGTTIDTVKTQVGRLMSKTGTNSRVLLVRAMLKADPPIARRDSPAG